MLRRLLARYRTQKILPKVDNCGERTDIRGFIDKRSPRGIVNIGSDCLIEGLLVTERDGSKIDIGNNVFIGGNSLLDCIASITIEDDVLISYMCILSDSDNHSIRYSLRKNDLQKWKKGTYDWAGAEISPILIRRGAWLGAGCIILKGVTIGEGAVIGAGSVITKSVPDWTIAAGNPAKIIRELTENER